MTKYLDPLGRYTDNEELQRQSREYMDKLVEKNRKKRDDDTKLMSAVFQKAIDDDKAKAENELARLKAQKMKELEEEFEKKGLKTEKTKRIEDAYKNLGAGLLSQLDD